MCHLFHCLGLTSGSLADSYLVCCFWPAWIPAQHELPFLLPRSYCYSKLSKECLQGRAPVSQFSLNHPVLFALEICIPCRHCNTSPVLTVTGKMVKTTEWDRPFWAPECLSHLVRDGGVGQSVQKNCQYWSSVTEASRAGTFKETQGACGQPTYFGPWLY